MPHAQGAYLGSVRCIADVRLRCVVDDECGCWHLRTAHGKPQPRGRVHRLWVHGRGAVSATRAVWELDRGMPMLKGRRAVRVCESYDCVNPQHLKALTHAEAQRWIVGAGEHLTAARRLQLRTIQRGRRKLTDAQVREIRHSGASAAGLARAFGVSPTTVVSVRNGVSYRDGGLHAP